ncbi:hypothetical protein FBU30_008265 [Linnemannia zychae]|nr:hypothetical protein FBU30_008265 [Linnemannia zychae]
MAIDAPLDGYTSTRSKREIIAFDGIMFDLSVLQDRDDDKFQPSSIEVHRQDRGLYDTSPPNHNDEETLVTGPFDNTKQQTASPPPSSSVLLLSSSLSSSSPTSSTSSIMTDTHSPNQSPDSDSGSAESFFSLATEGSADSDQSESPLPSLASSRDELGHDRDSSDLEDIKEVQIEAEDPSHLFWVPFHMHPEIAPNAYNNWLHKHGIDSSGQNTLLAVRKSSVNRRRSVLSAEYNPELDDDDEEGVSIQHTVEKESEIDIPGHVSETNTDFLSGVFSAPLEQMGEPPLKTKTSLRRSLSRTRNTSSSPPVLTNESSVEEDLATVRRTGGLQRSGPSLLRRSARTKIRRNSTASNDRNDESRLRQMTDENGEYPAVTLVDPGPLPLPPDTSTLALAHVDNKQDAISSDSQPIEPKPLKRFVSTLRDSSKPTITTYVEPELLEQQRQELEGLSKPQAASTPIFRNISAGQSNLPTYTGSVVSSVTYPIPPPVKLSQNLLQHPPQQSKSTTDWSLAPTHPSKQHPSKPAAPPTPPTSFPSVSTSRKSSTWSWLRGKEKESDVRQDVNLQSKRGSVSTPVPSMQASKTAAKKPSALSLLFSRNGKTSKVQSTAAGHPAPVTNRNTQRNIAHDGNCDYVPWRMPIHTERAIYRLSHVKLANPRRPLHEQVLISNMMFWYLGVIEQEAEMQQRQQQQQQSYPHGMPLPPGHNPSELIPQHQPPITHQQTPITIQSTQNDHINVKPIESNPAVPISLSPCLQQKKSQPELSATEARVEGSDDLIPQQDSNSHARSPGKEVYMEYVHRHPEDDYDEESMIGGYSEWSDEDDSQKPAGDNVDDKNRSMCLRSGSPVQSGFSVYSTSSLDLSNGLGTVSVV